MKYLFIVLYRKLHKIFSRYNCRGFGGLQAIPQGVTAEQSDEQELCGAPEGRIAPMDKIVHEHKRVPILLLILGIWFTSGVNPVRSNPAERDVPPTAETSNGVNGESFEDLVWKNMSKEITEVNAVWVDSQSPRIILIGTNRGIFKTEDGGNSWQISLVISQGKVNFIYAKPNQNKNRLYAATASGLFLSENRGRSWQRIFRGKDEYEANCLSIITINNKIYLGTEAGLFISRDNRTWYKISGELGSLGILALAENEIKNLLYLVCPKGVYKIKPDDSYERIFVVKSSDSDADEKMGNPIKYISVDPSNPANLYIATALGVYKSSDSGQTWELFSDSGLLSKDIRFITVSLKSTVFALTHSDIYSYKQSRWQRISERLAVYDVRFLVTDTKENLYVATDKGLFLSINYADDDNRLLSGEKRSGEKKEPTIQEMQKAAIRYTQVTDPERIQALRRGARLKAILPEFSLEYNKTIQAGGTGNNFGRFAEGPRDWSVSLKWSLSDLIWSEQQRLIDSQVRLMVQLRNDILDEVTKIYFERKRLQFELSCEDLELKKRREKELRLEELTALLDGLTGGYLSKNAKFNLTE